MNIVHNMVYRQPSSGKMCEAYAILRYLLVVGEIYSFDRVLINLDIGMGIFNGNNTRLVLDIQWHAAF